MKEQHADPYEAVRIMMACGAQQGLGVHWGTFQLTNRARLVPKEALAAALRIMISLQIILSPSNPETFGLRSVEVRQDILLRLFHLLFQPRLMPRAPGTQDARSPSSGPTR